MKATTIMPFQITQVSKARTLLVKQSFDGKNSAWEESDDDEEFAGFEQGKYVMENRDAINWRYFHLHLPLNRSENFEIHARLRVENFFQMGQFGLVWGFNKKPGILNKFCLTADRKRLSVMQFEKDHQRIYHRFSAKWEMNKKAEKSLFTIMRIKPYFIFKINDRLAYIGHETHFAFNGSCLGYYVEPGLKISSDLLEVYRLD